jgi:hypothetical protein
MEPGAHTQSLEYRPELISRRGEYFAWGMALLSLAAWLVLHLTNTSIFGGLSFLTVLLVFSGMAISLGNWMDRRTILRVESNGVWFDNGLRRVFLHWSEIRQVQVIPSSWGKKVRVIGESGHFDFRTLGEVWLQGEVRGRLGFEKGDEILSQILSETNLKLAKDAENGEYYGRE